MMIHTHIEILDSGQSPVVGIRPLNPHAKDWLRQNTIRDDWQWQDDILWITRNKMDAVVEALREAGLV